MKLTTVLAALMLAAAMAFAACGDDDDDGGGGGGDEAKAPAAPAKFTITAPGTNLSIDGTPQPGVTEITLTNEGKENVGAQLIRIEGDHSEAEIKAIYAGAGEGKAIPDWLRAEGGIGIAAPGKSATVTQELEPGAYYAVNDSPDKATFTPFEVSGEASDAKLPATDAAITAREYSFKPSGLTAGSNSLIFENAGKEPHHFLALPILPGNTFKEAKRFLTGGKGKSPVDFDKAAGSGVIDGGKTMVLDLDLQKGDYALVCFVSDRAGGPSHAEQGMVTEATVQ